MSMDWCHHCSTLIDTDYELEFYGVENKCANCREAEQEIKREEET